MPPRLLKALKIAVGCSAAILIARLLGLEHGTSAGVITLLSIQDTRRDTFRVAGKRFLDFFLALGLALLTFPSLRYGVLAFGVFLFLFTLLCYLLSSEEGLSSNVVLASHYWIAGALTPRLVLNELALLVIGVGLGILVNTYMRDISGRIRQDQAFIDESLRNLLLALSDRLEGRPPRPHMEFSRLRAHLKDTLARSRAHEDNRLRKETRYYSEYAALRRNQCALLENMWEAADGLSFLPEQAAATAALLRDVAASFHRLDNAGSLLEELEGRRAAFRTAPLPATREEFEARALLYQIVRDLIYLLRAKKEFAGRLTEEQLRDLWPEGPQDCTARP